MRKIVKRRAPTTRAPACGANDHVDGAIQPVFFLGIVQFAGMLVQIAVMGDFVPAFKNGFNEIAETRECPSVGWPIWIRLSASMSNVTQAAQRAPFGQGIGLRIMA